MVRPGEMVNAPVHFRVGIACALGTELPDAPIRTMFRVEEVDEGVERVAVCALRVGCGRA